MSRMKDMAIDRMNELKAPEMMSEYEVGAHHSTMLHVVPDEFSEVVMKLADEHMALRDYARRVSQMGII